jgi:methyl-accepting chemotaxis protein
MSRSIAAPLTILTKTAQELSLGNILHEGSDGAGKRLHLRKDEIGAISRAFDQLMNYFDGAANASAAIANKDLTITVTPNSDRDELGIAFSKMLGGLQHVIGEVSENARAVASAASQLAAASAQSGQAANQIALTIQQVALGTSQQSHEVSKTSGSAEQMNRAIQEVARGAREQGQAVDKASSMAVRISSTIQQVAANAQSGVRGAREAADTALSGARTIEATITGMQAIKAKVGLSAQKVREMGQRSKQIDTIVESINEIASQTNLLALNAAIEAARVESQGEKTVESILQRHLLGAASLVAELLAAGRELNSQDLQALARQSQVEQFSISDLEGTIVAASNPESLGFRFSDDTRHQSSVFRSLLSQRDGVVVQPIRARDQDGKPYVFVGVSRRDCPGIVQAGISGEVVYRLGGYSRGFVVVADEIRKLADHAKCATKEISTNIQAIQKVVLEAGKVMETGLQDVENRSAQAAEAGTSLATILQTVEAVNRQIGEIATAVQHTDESSKELVRSMETVRSVVKENIAATEDMAANSREIARSMESIASISEENSAAVEEVGASAEEISAQVQEVGAAAQSLADMAQTLQELVGDFTVTKPVFTPAAVFQIDRSTTSYTGGGTKCKRRDPLLPTD